MAMTNRERVDKALDLLRQGIAPFAEREFRNVYRTEALRKAQSYFEGDPLAQKPLAEWDASLLLKLMWESWNEVFRQSLGFTERSLVSELRDWRNKWAHQENFSGDDADRALDSAARLLTAVSAEEADDVGRMKMELRRLVFDEQVRSEKRRAGGSLVEAAAGSLKPWRRVVTPHADVAKGDYQQAEFAADLWQVYLGEGGPEYRDPREFFQRTYLTESLKRLLVDGVQRLSGKGGDPVVQLQTNFGGGKTHSMLALYHLFSGATPGELAGIEDVLKAADVAALPKVRRVVLVGNKISPGNPVTKRDGTVVRTLWGELAWQLGGVDAYRRVAADDERATSPGDVLRELFRDYGPCLVLVDEWVAYARQLHEQSDLPGGSFETQFSFAQVLTESAKLAGNCLLVISLPASDAAGAPHAVSDDVEVGGVRGREALDRLRNVVGRVESSWRPASAEEGFEIVRRRLFEPLSDANAFKFRDVTARAFAELYRAQQAEFPPECRESEYEDRIRAAYPIHPEIFDRLYTDWSTLVKFQRTRGVLRLMAAVIHSLWESGDGSPLILPSTIPIDDPRVQSELTRYLSDNWIPIIGKDVDGPNSLPMKIDGDNPNLGKFSATRRVARTVYLGSAPTKDAAHKGIEDRRVKLGCVMPGESPAIFGDGLRRLAAGATYLYQDGTMFWYATQPTVTKLAEDRAEQFARDPDRAARELEQRLRADLKKSGDFSKIHVFPRSSADVPDDCDARLVVLPADVPYAKGEGNSAEAAAQGILKSRGNAPRMSRNTLVFLAADAARLQDLDEAVRKLLAWTSILAEKDALNLAPGQVRQAEAQRQSAESTVTARLPETYQWLLVPGQKMPQSPVEWHALRLSGGDGLAVRAGRKLRNDDRLTSVLGPAILRQYMDRVPLWRGDCVSIRQLAADFATYLYLPRLTGPDVLAKAVCEGAVSLAWRSDTFAFAEGYDENAKRYIGLRGGAHVSVTPESGALLVKPSAAERQMEAEAKPVTPPARPDDRPGGDGGTTVEPPLIPPNEKPGTGETDGGSSPKPPVPPKLKRFYGSVTLDATRVGRDAGKIAEEVISHLAGQVGATVRVTLEIEADIPDGADENLVRAVTENSSALKFTSQAFERE